MDKILKKAVSFQIFKCVYSRIIKCDIHFFNRRSTATRINDKVLGSYEPLSILHVKTLKMVISTSVWNAQHPNAGQNIQHPPIKKVPYLYDNYTSARRRYAPHDVAMKNENKI